MCDAHEPYVISEVLTVKRRDVPIKNKYWLIKLSNPAGYFFQYNKNASLRHGKISQLWTLWEQSSM